MLTLKTNTATLSLGKVKDINIEKDNDKVFFSVETSSNLNLMLLLDPEEVKAVQRMLQETSDFLLIPENEGKDTHHTKTENCIFGIVVQDSANMLFVLERKDQAFSCSWHLGKEYLPELSEMFNKIVA